MEQNIDRPKPHQAEGSVNPGLGRDIDVRSCGGEILFEIRDTDGAEGRHDIVATRGV
ncbi:hypothetical protein [Sphingomonas alpina]|uniref:Uncharacterized protein n=1 Tax=Sphingomonas alpina TaxID=653931 RepID=A0A7H0LDW7_9SPHN|nr:hypothetical protein [Sphingomonas alpina]QNQ07870.1 hypothetical protein H3Z74_13805 [Sphingomonas alpina]